jgi:hypothetical protein
MSLYIILALALTVEAALLALLHRRKSQRKQKA